MNFFGWREEKENRDSATSKAMTNVDELGIEAMHAAKQEREGVCAVRHGD